MKIAVLNYADVRNFGDVLFPLIVAREITKRIHSAEITFITPTGSSWAGMDSIRLDMASLESFDAAILGGGEIVHRYDRMLKDIYGRFGLESIDRPTDLVFDWAKEPIPFKAWLGLGVPPLTPEAREAIAATTSNLDYVGVRGSFSKARLIECRPSDRVVLTPDIGWLFPRLLEDRQPPAHPAKGNPFIVIQSLEFLDVKSTADSLLKISEKTGLRIVLLPLTRCWQDVIPLSELQAVSNGEFFLVNDSVEDLDKLAILGGATLYLGQSMHGFIGAMGQCRPGGILQPKTDDKFGELLNDAHLAYCLAPGWEELRRLTDSLLWVSAAHIVEKKAAIERKLDATFDDICARITTT